VSFSILLLEDDLLFGETLEDFLEEEEFEVTRCRNGEEAIVSSWGELPMAHCIRLMYYLSLSQIKAC